MLKDYYENLPDIYKPLVLGQFTNRDLFDILRDTKHSSLELTSKPFYASVRLELFKRRGASSYQSSLLGSWLKHWSTAKKLSFIKNHTGTGKHVWLKLLDAALRDPLSSYEHRIRCCLFINKLFPNTHDITPSVSQ
ncbi:MAG: hypothetical protein ACHQAX_06610, partial [Gammaproteobacteria bacterium]